MHTRWARSQDRRLVNGRSFPCLLCLCSAAPSRLRIVSFIWFPQSTSSQEASPLSASPRVSVYTYTCHFPIIALIHSFIDLFYCQSSSSCWRYSGEQKRLKESKDLALTEFMFTRVKKKKIYIVSRIVVKVKEKNKSWKENKELWDVWVSVFIQGDRIGEAGRWPLWLDQSEPERREQ